MQVISPRTSMTQARYPEPPFPPRHASFSIKQLTSLPNQVMSTTCQKSNQQPTPSLLNTRALAKKFNVHTRKHFISYISYKERKISPLIYTLGTRIPRNTLYNLISTSPLLPTLLSSAKKIPQTTQMLLTQAYTFLGNTILSW